MRWFMHFHNQYAEILTEVGLIGLALFLWMFYRIFKIPLRDKQFIAIKIILVSVFLVGFIAEPYLHKQFTLALFSLVLGILLAQSRVDNDDAPALSVEPADSSLDIEPANAVLAGDLR
jgi:O-antigen ligase